jgi:hypothetical protein
MKHKDDCDCFICKGGSREKLELLQEELMEKYGWYSHAVYGGPLALEVHTHGMEETYEHLDLQLALPFYNFLLNPENVIKSILWAIAKRIDQGEIFKDGELVDGVLPNYKVKLVATTENERTVLRVILPDKDGNLDQETITGVFADQYLGIRNENG